MCKPYYYLKKLYINKINIPEKEMKNNVTIFEVETARRR